MPMKGARAHIRRLKKLASPRELRPIGQAVFEAAELIQQEAQISITTGAVSGKGHVPSRPGEPPNADSHVLADNIRSYKIGPFAAMVRSEAPYALIEWDWGRVAARPYMRPARDKKLGEAQQKVTDALNFVIRRSRSGDA